MNQSDWLTITSTEDLFIVVKNESVSAVQEPEENKEKIEMVTLAVKIIEEMPANTDVNSAILEMKQAFRNYHNEKEEKKKRKGNLSLFGFVHVINIKSKF